MHIMIFTDSFLPKIDGVAISVSGFSRLLAGRGHRITICCPRYGADDPAGMGENIRVLRFRGLSLPSYPDIKIALPELIRHGKNGFICRPFDPEAMAAHIITIAGDRRLYRAFSANGLQIAAEHDIISCANRLEGIYYREIRRKSGITHHRRFFTTTPPQRLGRAAR